MPGLRAAIVLSGLGHVVHNVAEFSAGADSLRQTVLPAAVTVALLVAARRPTRRVLLAGGAWAGVVVLVGAASVFPLPFLPFVPAQTAGHYAAHGVHALLQVPLLFIVQSSRAAPAHPAVDRRCATPPSSRSSNIPPPANHGIAQSLTAAPRAVRAWRG